MVYNRSGIVVFLFMSLTTVWTRGQYFQTTLSGNNDEEACGVVECSNGDIAVLSSTNSIGAGGEDIALTRLSPAGNVLWTRTYGSATADEDTRDLTFIETIDDGFLIVGRTVNSGGIFFAYILKTDANGLPEWEKTYYTGGGIGELCRAVIQTSDSNYVVGGTINNTTAFGNSDAFLIKLDGSGNVLWFQNYGLVGNDHISDISELPNGDLVTTSNSEQGPGARAGIILKFDSAGNFIWGKAYGGTGTDGFECIIQKPDGGFLTAGRTSTWGAGSYDFLMTKLDSSGTVEWMKAYGGSGYETSACIRILPDGTYVFSGSSDSYDSGDRDMILVNIDVNGTVLWSQSVGFIGEDYVDIYAENAMDITSSGHILLAGTIENSVTGKDVYLGRLANNGSSTCTPVTLTTTNITPTTFNFTYNTGVFGSVQTATFSSAPAVYNNSPVCFCPMVTDISNDTLICVSDSALLSASGGDTYQWIPANGLACDTCQTTLASPSFSTNYQVLISKNACTDTLDVTVVVDTNTLSNIVNPSPICDNTSAFNLVATPAGGIWSGPGIVNPITGLFDPAIAGPGSFQVIYDPNGCALNDTILVAVIPTTTAIITDPDTVCFGDPAFNLIAAPPGGIWSGTGIVNVSAGTFDPAVSGPGTFDIIYAPGGACGVNDTIQLIVEQNFVAAIDPVGNLCDTGPDIVLTASPAGGTWSGPGIINNTTGSFSPSLAGVGVVQIVYDLPGSCSTDDTVSITISPTLVASIIDPGVICVGEPSLNLTASPSGGIFAGTGITDVTLGTFDPAVSGPGSFQIIYDLPGVCDIDDTIIITVADTTLPFNTDTSICENTGPFNLPPGNWSGTGVVPGNPPVFDPGITGAGTFNLTYLSGNTCISNPILTVNVYPTPYFYLGPDTTICPICSLVLNPGNSGLSYTWQDNSQAPVYIVQSQGIYSVTGTDQFGCSFTDYITVGMSCDYAVFIPNVFTPNGDGINDLFYPVANNLDSFNMKIFNRWGQLLWESNDPFAGWTGKYNGYESPDGVYVYVITYLPCHSTKTETKSGHITLIR